MNSKQIDALTRIKKRFNYVSTPERYVNQTYTVEVGPDAQHILMIIGIEPDGHAHS